MLMSYRDDQGPEICGVPEHAKVHLLNGASTEFEVTCKYVIPAAGSEPETTELIHLTDEGYTNPVVVFDAGITGLTGNAWIDDVDDSIVHVVFMAACAAALTEDLECKASILISRDSTDPGGTRTDVLLRALVEVEAAPLPPAGQSA
jgi:hypothetical protein